MAFIEKTFDRAKQTVGERFFDIAKTELEPELTAQIQRSEVVKALFEKILAAIEGYIPLEGSVKIPGVDQMEAVDRAEKMLATIESYVPAKSGVKVPTLENRAEHLSHAMTNLVVDLEKWDGKSETHTTMEKQLRAGALAFTELGKLERTFVSEVSDKLVVDVKKFLSEDMKIVEHEKKLLNTNRIDMDCLKNRQLKTPDDEKLKTEVDESIKVFEEQKQKLKKALDDMEQKLAFFGDDLKKFAQANIKFFAEAQKILENWQKEI